MQRESAPCWSNMIRLSQDWPLFRKPETGPSKAAEKEFCSSGVILSEIESFCIYAKKFFRFGRNDRENRLFQCSFRTLSELKKQNTAWFFVHTQWMKVKNRAQRNGCGRSRPPYLPSKYFILRKQYFIAQLFHLPYGKFHCVKITFTLTVPYPEFKKKVRPLSWIWEKGPSPFLIRIINKEHKKLCSLLV